MKAPRTLLGEMISGAQITSAKQQYGLAHEAELWSEFSAVRRQEHGAPAVRTGARSDGRTISATSSGIASRRRTTTRVGQAPGDPRHHHDARREGARAVGDQWVRAVAFLLLLWLSGRTAVGSVKRVSWCTALICKSYPLGVVV